MAGNGREPDEARGTGRQLGLTSCELGHSRGCGVEADGSRDIARMFAWCLERYHELLLCIRTDEGETIAGPTPPRDHEASFSTGGIESDKRAGENEDPELLHGASMEVHNDGR